MKHDPMFERHRWEDGSEGERLRPWAAIVNVLALSAIAWAVIYYLVRLYL